jgi:hypothetical protein
MQSKQGEHGHHLLELRILVGKVACGGRSLIEYAEKARLPLSQDIRESWVSRVNEKDRKSSNKVSVLTLRMIRQLGDFELSYVLEMLKCADKVTSLAVWLMIPLFLDSIQQAAADS